MLIPAGLKREAVQGLRPFLEGRSNASEYLRFFDEFLEHREFGLALWAVCDYFLEHAVPIDRVTFDRIGSLAAQMELADDCIEAVRGNIKER